MEYFKIIRVLVLFSFSFCNIQYDFCLAQTQTTTSIKNEEYLNLDITLNGKVKFLMNITHWPDFSYDTIKSYTDNSFYENIHSGVVVINKCTSDTVIYYFNQNLLPSKIVKIDFSVNEFNIRYRSETVYEFDNGLLISIISKDFRGTNMNRKFKYDSNKNLILKTDNSYYSEYSERFEFDEKNNLIKKESYSFNLFEDKKPKLISNEEYQYDSLNHLIKKKWAKNRVDIFKYDSLGNMIEKGCCFTTKQNKCDYKPSEGFIYDTNNRMVKRFLIGKWSPHNTDSYYEYDKEGRKIDAKGYYITKDTVLGYHLTYEYNQKGELIQEESKIGSGTHFSPKYIQCKKKTTTYDNYGNITQIVLYNSNFFEVQIYRFVYTYDLFGNWTKKEEYEGESEDKLVRTKIEDRIIEYY